MEAVFLRLLNLSLTASILAAAIIIVRLIFRRAPKWLFCLLWGLVGLRLIVPFPIESSLSLIPSAEPVPKEIIYSAEPQIKSGISVLDDLVNPVLSRSMTPAVGASANPSQIMLFVLSWVWLCGASVMIGYAVISSVLLKRKLRTATLYQKGIKRSEAVDSPFVLGIFRPVIYLPYQLEGDDLSNVIAHERAHIRRRDHWWKPLGFLLLSAYWFNPVMWAAYVLLCRDIEAACDEKVVRNMERDALRAYSAALLRCSVRRGRFAACPLAFGEFGVKKRVKNVMSYKKPAFWLVIAAVAAGIAVAVCFMTSPIEKNDHENPELNNDVMVPGNKNEFQKIVLSHYWYDGAPQRTEAEILDGEVLAEFAKALDLYNLEWNDDITKLEPEEAYTMVIDDDIVLHVNYSKNQDRWYIDELKNGILLRETDASEELISMLSNFTAEHTKGSFGDTADLSVLENLSKFTLKDWDNAVKDGAFNNLCENIESSAIGDQQAQRDIYVMTAFLNSDGAYAEFLSGILALQREADSVAWEAAISGFSEQDAEMIRFIAEAG